MTVSLKEISQLKSYYFLGWFYLKYGYCLIKMMSFHCRSWINRSKSWSTFYHKGICFTTMIKIMTKTSNKQSNTLNRNVHMNRIGTKKNSNWTFKKRLHESQDTTQLFEAINRWMNKSLMREPPKVTATVLAHIGPKKKIILRRKKSLKGFLLGMCGTSFSSGSGYQDPKMKSCRDRD
jgi:hypothetical protein